MVAGLELARAVGDDEVRRSLSGTRGRSCKGTKSLGLGSAEHLEHGKRRRRAEGGVDVRSRSRDARLVAGAVRRMWSPRRCDAVDAAAEDVRGAMGDGEPRW